VYNELDNTPALVKFNYQASPLAIDRVRLGLGVNFVMHFRWHSCSLKGL